MRYRSLSRTNFTPRSPSPPSRPANTFSAKSPRRYWDFRSLGHGDVVFEDIIVALNDVNYQGPLSVEWEDSRMDREHGAAEAAAFVKRIDFKRSAIAFDAQFDR